MIITNKLKLDLQTPGILPTIHAVQNDSYSRNLEITLFSDRKPFVFPDNGAVVIRYKKSDGKGGEYDTLPDGTTAWWAERNVLTVALAPQVLTTPGSVHLSVSLIANGTQLSIFPIHLAVAPIAAGKTAKSENYFYITGLLPAPVSGNVGQCLRIAAVNNQGRITALDAVDGVAWTDTDRESLVQDVIKALDTATFNPTDYGLPVLHLTGDTTGMSKDNAVSLDYVYGERSGECTLKWQGSSSLAFPKKNYTIQFDEEFAAQSGWGTQKKYCLKANYNDYSHARNVVSAKLWGQIVKSRPVELPANVQLFDISKITHFESASGTKVGWTRVEDDAFVITSTCYMNGVNLAAGCMFNEEKYTISFDVINATESVIEDIIVGFGAGNEKSQFYQPVNDTLQTIRHFEITLNNTVPNAYFYVVPSKADGQVNLTVSNIHIVKQANDFGFTHFVNRNDETITWAIVENDTFVVMSDSYNMGYGFAAGQTFDEGIYDISFDVVSANDSTVENILTGFGKGSSVIKSAQAVNGSIQETRHFEFTVENTIPDAYFFAQPDKVTGSINFTFSNIRITKQGAEGENDNEGININYTISRLINGGAIDGFPIVVMLNNAFHGLYSFNIPKDGWMMGMGDGENEAILCAEIGAPCLFNALATLDGDFDLEYVSNEEDAEWVLTSINRLIGACMNSDGTDLDTTIAQYLDWESAIDFMIFRELINAWNLDKRNYLLSTYDGVKWFFTPYDLDDTYGKSGFSTFYEAKYGTPYDIGHKLYDLVLDNKKDALKARYTELRNGAMSDDNVVKMFTNYIGGIPAAVLAEDAKKWPGTPNTAVNNLGQIVDYYLRRAKWLDEYMETL